MQTNKEKTWMPTVAGVLNIIVGSLRLLAVFGIIIAIVAIYGTSYWWDYIEGDMYPLTLGAFVGILIVVAVFLFVAGILSFLGGISALQRKWWGLALAGSIASVFGPVLLGIPAIIFTVMSKDEFV
jgi:uncharacterized membrane protein HdeD (DUF308 family)